MMAHHPAGEFAGQLRSVSVPSGCKGERVSVSKLHNDGRDRAIAAATSLVGLGHEETLARIAEFREGLTARKAAMGLSGFSHDEVQAWEDGYVAGLFERVGGWLPYSGNLLPPNA